MLKAVIPAAGVGTRLLPVTKVVPKEILPLVDRPSLQYVIEEAAASGIRDVALVVSPGKKALVDYFRPAPKLEGWLRGKGKTELAGQLEALARLARVSSVLQRRPLGLGHAVLCAEKFVGRHPFAVMLPDDIFDAPVPCLAEMVRLWDRFHAPVISLAEVKREEVSSYGIVRARRVSSRVVRIEDMVEKPRPEHAPSCLGIVGRYVLPPEVFPAIRATRPGWGGEIQLTDGLRALLRRGPVYGLVHRGRRLDMGSRAGLVVASAYFALKRKDLAPEVRKGLKALLGVRA